MSIKIALAGNPNSGKSTLFNALTGSNQFVGNWPGVTVEKKKASSNIMTTSPSLTCRVFTFSVFLRRSWHGTSFLKNVPM